MEKEIDKALYSIYQKEASKLFEALKKGSLTITPNYDDTIPPESDVVKWIKIEGKDTLPPLNTECLLWYYIGHRYHRYIGELVDTNNYEKGFNESYSCVGVHQYPLNEYPENMRWIINGHSEKLNEVTYWAKI